MEARIHGFQVRINLMFDILEENKRRWDIRPALELKLDEFFDCQTGGDFEVVERETDPDRAKDVQVTAAELVCHLRKARYPFSF